MASATRFAIAAAVILTFASACGQTPRSPFHDRLTASNHPSPPIASPSPTASTSTSDPGALGSLLGALTETGPGHTAADVEHAFLDPAGAGMPLGLTTTGDRGQVPAITACLPPNDADREQVAVNSEYAVAWRVISTSTLKVSQAGWVFPNAETAHTAFTRLARHASSCTYAITHVQPLDGLPVTETSTAKPIVHGPWVGLHTEKITSTRDVTLEATTQLVARHGNTIVWLTYNDSTFDPTEAHRTAQRLAHLVSVLDRLG